MQSQIQNEIFHHPVRTEDSVSWWWIRDRFERFWCWMHCGGFCEELWVFFLSFFTENRTYVRWDGDRVKQPKGQFVRPDSWHGRKGNELVFGETCHLEYAEVIALKSKKNADFQLYNTCLGTVNIHCLSSYSEKQASRVWDVKLHKDSIGKNGECECDATVEDFLEMWLQFIAYIIFIQISVNAWMHIS